MPDLATQFKAVSTPSGKRAFEAYCAVWLNGGNEIAICAPTLEALEAIWFDIATSTFNKEMVQRVFIVSDERTTGERQ